MARVYVETSIISYLSARPSRDVVIAAHQALTRRWWRGRRTYTLVASQLVADEAAVGDSGESAKRLRALVGIPRLARSTIEATCRSVGLTPPIICTPEELPSGGTT